MFLFMWGFSGRCHCQYKTHNECAEGEPTAPNLNFWVCFISTFLGSDLQSHSNNREDSDLDKFTVWKQLPDTASNTMLKCPSSFMPGALLCLISQTREQKIQPVISNQAVPYLLRGFSCAFVSSSGGFSPTPCLRSTLTKPLTTRVSRKYWSSFSIPLRTFQ